MELDNFINTINGAIQQYCISPFMPTHAIALFKAENMGESVRIYGCWIDMKTHKSFYSTGDIANEDVHLFKLVSKWPG